LPARAKAFQSYAREAAWNLASALAREISRLSTELSLEFDH
jgi:hypothetical protein